MTATQATEAQLFIEQERLETTSWEDNEPTFVPVMGTSFTLDWEPENDGALADFQALAEPASADWTVSYSQWFAPVVTLHDVTIEETDTQENDDGETVVDMRMKLIGASSDFAHWWHRPIWWMYTRWVGLKERLT